MTDSVLYPYARMVDRWQSHHEDQWLRALVHGLTHMHRYTKQPLMSKLGYSRTITRVVSIYGW